MWAVARDLGIDPGTSSLVISARGRGIVVHEPSVVAIAKASGQPRAFGSAAAAMIGRAPDAVETIHPIRAGAIAHYTATEAMLRHFLERVNGKHPLVKPRVVVSVPSDATSVERAAVLDACRGAGAREVLAIEEPLAAALGLGLAIGDPQGHLVMDVGGGTTDIAVIALGGIVVSESVRVGGDKIDEAIHRHVKRVHNLLLGERGAGEVKIAIAAATLLQPEVTFEVRGRDLVGGMPRTARLSSTEIHEAIAEPIGAIIARLRAVLERTPPELINDIARAGIWLTGGSGSLRGLSARIERETGLPAHLPDQPALCVAQGTGRALDQIEALREAQGVSD